MRKHQLALEGRRARLHTYPCASQGKVSVPQHARCARCAHKHPMLASEAWRLMRVCVREHRYAACHATSRLGRTWSLHENMQHGANDACEKYGQNTTYDALAGLLTFMLGSTSSLRENMMIFGTAGLLRNSSSSPCAPTCRATYSVTPYCRATLGATAPALGACVHSCPAAHPARHIRCCLRPQGA